MKKVILTMLLATVMVIAQAANVTMTVNNSKYQYIKGFGAFVCSPQFTYNHMSESEIRQVWGPNSTLAQYGKIGQKHPWTLCIRFSLVYAG